MLAPACATSPRRELDGWKVMAPRTRILVPGALVVAGTGLLAGACSIQAGWVDRSSSTIAAFLASVLMAPMSLVVWWLYRESAGVFGVPPETAALALLALVATPLRYSNDGGPPWRPCLGSRSGCFAHLWLRGHLHDTAQHALAPDGAARRR